MSYMLAAGVRSGTIYADDLGTHSIDAGKIEVSDYEIASALVNRYSAVEWRGEDPGPPSSSQASGSDGSDDSDSSDESDGFDGPDGPEEDDSLVEALQELTIPEFEDELEDGRFDGRLDVVEDAEERGQDRDGVYDAVEQYRDDDS